MIKGAQIKEITSEAGIRRSVPVIREAFKTVAVDFNLTKQNCPTHPSFITHHRLQEIRDAGLHFFGLFLAPVQVGFICIEPGQDGVYCLEKLAVLPEYRHRGYGRELIEFALDYIRQHNGRKVSLGIIDEHQVLKDWYLGLGFTVRGINNFIHLPFTVCFMEMPLGMQDKHISL